MIADLRKRVERTPVAAFSIRMSAGHEYAVPTLGHVCLPLGGRSVVGSDDEGIVAVVPALHLSALI
ncbi:MAG TPA: hypothetical protein VF345_02775 [Chthoniobacterales bacterium]